MRILAVVQSLIIAGLLLYTISLRHQLEALHVVVAQSNARQAGSPALSQPAAAEVTSQTTVAKEGSVASPVRTQLSETTPESKTEQPATVAAKMAETAEPDAEPIDTDTDFDRQQIDFSWAPDFSRQLSGMFQQSSQLQTLKIKDIECRNSLCRVQIHNDDMDALRLGVMIGGALEESGFTDNAYQFATQGENGIFTVYVGRDKTSIRLN